MDGILYLLNQTGLALAEANQQIAQLREELRQRAREDASEMAVTEA